MQFHARLALAFLLILQTTCIVLGQERRATLIGTVRAVEGAEPLPDVLVRVLGTSAFTFTDARGFFRLENLPPTKLNIVFERIGIVRLDLRQFSADNIESIEVIRGIPLARHGDLTVGAILVQTRATAYKPQARLRLNPQTFESTLGAGWNFF